MKNKTEEKLCYEEIDLLLKVLAVCMFSRYNILFDKYLNTLWSDLY